MMVPEKFLLFSIAETFGYIDPYEMVRQIPAVRIDEWRAYFKLKAENQERQAQRTRM